MVEISNLLYFVFIYVSEGLSYGTVSALIIAAALAVSDSTNEKMTPVPDPENSTRRERVTIRLDNTLKILFSICMILTVAFGIYTSIVFTLMNIYGHTALGLGLNDSFVAFFDACSKYRQFGFYSFICTLISFNVGWLISVILNYEGKMRWRMVAPALLIGLGGMFHYKAIFNLASSLIFANLQ